MFFGEPVQVHAFFFAFNLSEYGSRNKAFHLGSKIRMGIEVIACQLAQSLHPLLVHHSRFNHGGDVQQPVCLLGRELISEKTVQRSVVRLHALSRIWEHPTAKHEIDYMAEPLTPKVCVSWPASCGNRLTSVLQHC